jgi:hypothetical protein
LRKRRRLARLLVFLGVCLWIPELYYAWFLISTLLTPIRASNGQLVQMHMHLNGSAWALAIGWTLVSWLLIGLGIRGIIKGRREDERLSG